MSEDGIAGLGGSGESDVPGPGAPTERDDPTAVEDVAEFQAAVADGSGRPPGAVPDQRDESGPAAPEFREPTTT